jgi:5-aminolevulinate synthase
MLDFFKAKISELKSENRYREFVDISRICGNFPKAINNKNNQEIIVWCSNDYLGMGQKPETIAKAIEVLNSYGIGSGGTRNISGTHHEMVKLENLVAKLHGKESGLVFVSGYVANNATIQSLAKIIPDLVIFSDQKNHASIISGIKNSNLTKEIFKHNNENHLEELLKKYPKKRPKLIIFESVYSMDGDFGKIQEFCNLAKKYNAFTYIDEVHSVGIYGKTGAGLAEELKLQNEVDIIQGTFGKAYGVIGGYIAGKKEVIDAIRLTASNFIFTTSLPPVITAASFENVNYLRNNSSERNLMKKKVQKIKELLKEKNIEIVENNSHIISVKISGAQKVKNISKRLLEEFNIYIQHINFPTVDRGDERLRITTTPLHDDKMINDLIFALDKVINSNC